ncbi:type VII toxin-antitoxin system HepT family RNase toxin [Brevibacillus thermoruber]|uniref:type VII toxin-antitoxin system HepT family RNase toxin n=1 Tax=Brevibacillus thermoruber TaxID=33942 RepID=UPI0005514039|nr:HepT-like ribonuclease domain-containing protein [Brevibacillus thermoruber]
MYDVNTKKIDEVLTHLSRMLDLLDKLAARGAEDVLADDVAEAAMERALHLSIEAVIDVGNALIDGFIMRDPGSYSDIVEILRDERVISDEQARVLTDVVEFRRHLVNQYTRVPAAEMVALVKNSLPTLRQFEPAVRTYLQNELF